MSKRGAEVQGGGDRYGFSEQVSNMASSQPQRATAAQMANRKIASAKSSIRSARSSRANTPNANPFNGGQTQTQNQAQTMSFQPGSNNFTFSAGPAAPAAPVFGQNGASSTPPPPTNPFAAPQNQTSQQNGSSGLFSSTFGSTGGSFGNSLSNGPGAVQPQQNGFTPSANVFGQTQNSNTTGTSLFGGTDKAGDTTTSATSGAASTLFSGWNQGQDNNNKDKDKDSNPFAAFGQSKSQQNGLTTNTSFASNNTHSQSNNQNSFTGFATSQPNNALSTPSTSFGGFGQSQQSSGTSLFSSNKRADIPKTTNDIFKTMSKQDQQNGSQTNGDKPLDLFGSTTQSASLTQPSTTNNIFSAQSNNNGTGLFGSNPLPTASSPNLGNSILSGLNQNKTAEIKPGMFTQSQSIQTNPETNNASIFQFGNKTSQKEQSTTGASEQPSKTSNLFGGPTHTQMNGPKSNLFGGSTNKPSGASLFSSTSAQAPAQDEQRTPKPNNLFNLGASAANRTAFSPSKSTQEDLSMTTPESTPHKATGVAPTPHQVINTVTSSQPATDTPAPLRGVKPASSSLFTPSVGVSHALQPSTATSRSLFEQTPATAAINATHASLHRPAVAPSSTVRVTTNEMIPESEKQTLKVLNEGLKAHLNSQDPHADWTTIFQYYTQEAAKIRKKAVPTFSSPQLQPQQSVTDTAMTAAANAPTSHVPKVTQDTTPMKAGSYNMFDPSKTAPNNTRKRSADENTLPIPATEKRSRPNDSKTYTPLPSGASNASKLFQSLYDSKTTAAGNASKAPTEAMAAVSPNDDADSPTFGPSTAMLEKAREDKAKAQSAAAPGFKPSTAGFTPSTSGFTPKPSTTGFTPTGSMPAFSAPSGGSGGFLAAFGQKANKQAESDKKKRKAEDFDSDEDNEEEWEAKDREEQEAKRKKLMDAGKSGKGFTFSSATSAASSDAGDKAATSDKASVLSVNSDTPKATGASLFDRITSRDPPATEPQKKNLFNHGAMPSASTTSNLFGSAKTPSHLDGSSEHSPNVGKTDAEKEQGTGDNTWKPDTPIKFGGMASQSFTPKTAPPKNPVLGNLFGSIAGNDKASVSGLLNVPGAKPSLNFNLGNSPSLATSRATTPGITTDGEGASTAGEGDATGDEMPKEKQVEEQTGLRDEEKEHEDLLFSVHVAKAMKYVEDKKDAETGELKPGWAEKGKGPLYILKHKETGKTRIILKLPPFGKPCMNFEPLAGVEYINPTAKSVKGPFVDHLDKRDADAGRVSTWLIQVGKPEDAKEINQLLNEGKPN